MLVIGGVLFLLAELVARSHSAREGEGREVTPSRGFIIGVFQALALIPGLSRAGMTISGGLFLGLSRVEAARFGFLLSFPIIAGSGLKKLFELESTGFLDSMGFPLLIAAIVACISGILAIRFMLAFLKNNSLVTFAVYRFILAAVVFWFFI
jgi:undecaprenyl-diphosphatase